MFCDPEYAASAEYRDFWKELGEGNFSGGEFQRRTKSGEEVWLQASYNPILNEDGKTTGVVKMAANITAAKNDSIAEAGKVEAINRSQAVIEFKLDGTIVTANDNFCAATGYSLDEIIGKHHRMFCSEEISASAEYRDFWADLNKGDDRDLLRQRHRICASGKQRSGSRSFPDDGHPGASHARGVPGRLLFARGGPSPA
jgi:methyl-accepting chemotaxis protein